MLPETDLKTRMLSYFKRAGAAVALAVGLGGPAMAAADAPDIDGRILLKSPAPVGEFVNVRITGTQVYDLIGEVVA